MNAVMQLLRSHRSIRKFTDQVVPDEIWEPGYKPAFFPLPPGVLFPEEGGPATIEAVCELSPVKGCYDVDLSFGILVIPDHPETDGDGQEPGEPMKLLLARVTRDGVETLD